MSEVKVKVTVASKTNFISAFKVEFVLTQRVVSR